MRSREHSVNAMLLYEVSEAGVTGDNSLSHKLNSPAHVAFGNFRETPRRHQTPRVMFKSDRRSSFRVYEEVSWVRGSAIGDGNAHEGNLRIIKKSHQPTFVGRGTLPDVIQ